MKFVSAWVMSILGIVIIGTIVDLLLSKSRLKNFIRSIFATVCILVIITPLPSIVKNGFDMDFSDLVGDIQIDDDFVGFSERQKVIALEKAIESAFDEEGISKLSVKADVEFESGNFTVKRITVDLTDSVINENLANINKYEFIKERVKKFTGNPEVEIIING
ncbi:MAG: hypothetical protein HFK08_07830 [Clostridia bacterium]|jgi:hypothetical protein|nr:hypothetical protein [Clostridia bacterium]